MSKNKKQVELAIKFLLPNFINSREKYQEKIIIIVRKEGLICTLHKTKAKVVT